MTTQQEIVDKFGEPDFRSYYDELHIVEEAIYKTDDGCKVQFVYKNDKLKVIWYVNLNKRGLEEITMEMAEKLLVNRSKLGKEIM